VTLDDLERQSKGFYGLFGDFGLQRTFWERIVPTPLQIDQYDLRLKFLTLNIDLSSPNLDTVGSKWPAHEGIKDWYPLKVIILLLSAVRDRLRSLVSADKTL